MSSETAGFILDLTEFVKIIEQGKEAKATLLTFVKRKASQELGKSVDFSSKHGLFFYGENGIINYCPSWFTPQILNALKD